MTQRTPELDFERIFDATPSALMVLDHELRYVAANAEYVRVTATNLDALLGKRIFDLFPNDENDPNNLPAQMLRRSLERVLATGQRDHLALIPYKVPMEVDGEVRTVERFWSATHTPIHGSNGKLAFILQHTVDVTALHAFESGDKAVEAGVLQRARAVQEDNQRLGAERERLRALFEQAPGFIAFLEGPDHVFSLANIAYQQVVGRKESELVGKPAREALPEVENQGFIGLLDRVFASGEPFSGQGVGIRLRRDASDGAALEEAFLDFVYQPVLGPDGAARGIFVQGHDVTARMRAQQAADAFAEELVEQSRAVKDALQKATARIAELEAALENAKR
jgi:PAS domain S-box-containing protein